LTTATADDDITAFVAVQEVAPKCWDLISVDSMDKTEHRQNGTTPGSR
jgi:hypothetical protein